MDLSKQNAKYIQHLNQSNIALEKNVLILEHALQTLEDTINCVARDSAAMQRAMIEFLKEKELIKDEDDVKLLQKLHMRHIAQLDQEIADRKAKKEEKG